MPDQHLTDRVNRLAAVFVFGGDITPASDPQHLGGLGWRSLKGLESDKTGAMPSYERVLASAVLHRMNPNLFLVPSGGLTNVKGAGESPPIASVMAAELRQLGVLSSMIIEEPKAFNSWEQVVNCSAMARERGWRASDIGVLSLFWHFGRIIAMLAQGGKQAPLAPFIPGVTPLISVERVLASEDAEKWNMYFTDLYAHPEMIKTLIGETAGTGQFLAGHSPRFPHPYKGFFDPLVM